MSDTRSVLCFTTGTAAAADLLPNTLGHAFFTPGLGWIYQPLAGQRHPKPPTATVEECLPRSLGYPDRCRSYWVRYEGNPVDPGFRAPAPTIPPPATPAPRGSSRANKLRTKR